MLQHWLSWLMKSNCLITFLLRLVKPPDNFPFQPCPGHQAVCSLAIIATATSPQGIHNLFLKKKTTQSNGSSVNVGLRRLDKSFWQMLLADFYPLIKRVPAEWLWMTLQSLADWISLAFKTVQRFLFYFHWTKCYSIYPGKLQQDGDRFVYIFIYFFNQIC